MEKKILIAVDKSKHSKNAVIYTVQMASTIKNLKYVLFHVEPMVSLYLTDEARRNVTARKELERVLKKNHEAAVELLEGYKAEMVRRGIDPDHIETHSVRRKLGVVIDILSEAREKRYTAVVVARRGISHLEGVVMGSVSAKLAEHSSTIPVWIVDGRARSANILVAMDGSEHSLRALEHVVSVTHDNPEARFTIYHVMRKDRDYAGLEFEIPTSPELEKVLARTNRHFVDEFHERAEQMLSEAGISRDRIEVRVAERKRNPGKAILEKIKSGHFGTVVLGRSGMSKSFFMGSVSNYVTRRATDCAVWLVP